MKQFLYTMIAIVFSFQTNTAFAQSRQDMRNEIREAKQDSAVKARTIINLDGQVEGSSPTKDFDPNQEKELMLALKKQALETSYDSKESYFHNLTTELNKLNYKGAELAKSRGVALNSLIHLPATKMAFHIIDGSIYALEAWANASSNPMKMVEHMNSTFDPTAWFSFYIFSASQGYYIDFKSKNLSPELKAQAMKSLMYKGMVMGSLASTLSADIINLFKECHTKRLDKKVSALEADKACELTLAQWTSRNMLNKYGPQILNLIANQIASDLTEVGVKKALTSKASQKVINSTATALILDGAELAISVSSFGLSVKAIKYLTQAMQFANFLAWDHILSPIMYKIGGHATFRWSSAVDISALERNSNWISTQRWDLENMKSRSDDRIAKYPEAVLDFNQFMKDWRFQLNKNNEENLSGWVEAQQQLINQVHYLLKAFNNFSFILSSPLEKNKVPFIPLPFYGINPDLSTDEKSNLTNGYLLNEKNYRNQQYQYIVKTAKEYSIRLENKLYSNLSNSDLNYIRALLADLQTVDIYKISQALVNLNTAVGIYDSNPAILKTKSYFPSSVATTFLENLRSDLGNPQPIFNPGIAYTYAYSTLDTNAYSAKEAKFPINGNYQGVRLDFKNPMSYIMFNMICGEEKSSVIANNTNGLTLGIPRITKIYQKQFCENLKSKAIANTNGQGKFLTIDEQLLFNTKVGNESFLAFMTNKDNIQYEFHGFGSENNYFGQWWRNHESNYLKYFDKFDEDIKEIIDNSLKKYSDVGDYEMSYVGLNYQFRILDKIMLGFSNYLNKTVKETYIFQTKVLLKLYKNYLNRDSNKYTTLGADFIKNIKSEVQDNNKYLEYPQNQELVQYVESFKKEISTKYLDNLITVNLREANVAFKDFNSSLQNAKNTFLNDKDVVNFIKKLVQLKLYYQSLSEEEKNKNLKASYNEAVKRLNQIQDQINSKYKLEILEILMINLIELPQSAVISFEEIEKRKNNALLYLEIALDSEKENQKLKDSPALERRFKYAIFEGLSSIITDVQRYSTMQMSMRDQFNLNSEQLKSLSEQAKSQKDTAAKNAKKGVPN